MAAIDPTAEPQIDENHKVPRATLRIIRVPMDLDDEDDDEDDEDFDGEDVESIIAKLRAGGVALPEEDTDSEEDSEDEANGGPSDKAKSKKAKPTFFEQPTAELAPEDDDVGKDAMWDMPSPSAAAPKPRRAKPSSKKGKGRQKLAHSMHGASDGEDGEAAPRPRADLRRDRAAGLSRRRPGCRTARRPAGQ